MKAFSFIPILVLFIACNNFDDTMTTPQKESLQKEASSVIKNVFDVLALGSGEKRMEFCENSEDFSFTLSDGIFSWQGLKDYVMKDFNEAVKENLETKTEKYILIDPACFIYVWSGKMEIYLKNGDVIVSDEYYSTWTFRKKNGEWKMVNGHESTKEPFHFATPKTQ